MNQEFLNREEEKSIRLEAILSVVIVAVLVAVVIVVGQFTRVNPNKYFTNQSKVKFEGYDGYGYFQDDLQPYFDLKQFYLDFTGNKDDNWDDLYDYLDLTVDKSDELKNGDKVTLTLTFDYDGLNSAYPQARHKMSGNNIFTKTYTVQGLKEVQTLDPYSILTKVYVKNPDDGIYLHWANTSVPIGDYTVKHSEGTQFDLVDSKGDVVVSDFLYFTSSNDYPEVGDKVTIDAGPYEEDDYLTDYGIVVKPLEKEFTVQSK